MPMMNYDNTEPDLLLPEPPSMKTKYLTCFMIIWILTAVIIILVINHEYQLFKRSSGDGNARICLSNTKSLGAAFLMYMADNDDRMPPGDNWLGEIDPYIRSKAILKCPSASTSDPCYAFNSKLGKVKVSDINAPDSTVMIFESIPGMNQCGGKELLPSPPRHLEGHSIAFMDGHARSVKPQEIDLLIWDVKTIVK